MLKHSIAQTLTPDALRHFYPVSFDDLVGNNEPDGRVGIDRGSDAVVGPDGGVGACVSVGVGAHVDAGVDAHVCGFFSSGVCVCVCAAVGVGVGVDAAVGVGC